VPCALRCRTLRRGQAVVGRPQHPNLILQRSAFAGRPRKSVFECASPRNGALTLVRWRASGSLNDRGGPNSKRLRAETTVAAAATTTATIAAATTADASCGSTCGESCDVADTVTATDANYRSVGDGCCCSRTRPVIISCSAINRTTVSFIHALLAVTSAHLPRGSCFVGANDAVDRLSRRRLPSPAQSLAMSAVDEGRVGRLSLHAFSFIRSTMPLRRLLFRLAPSHSCSRSSAHCFGTALTTVIALGQPRSEGCSHTAAVMGSPKVGRCTAGRMNASRKN
jgi:hypothetical protein